MEQPKNQRILSGIQPSGNLHIGNYLGALKQWVALAATNECYFCIVDEHAITVPYEPKDLQDRILDAAAMYVAAGLDPEKCIVFVQSHIPQHTELAWLLSTITPSGELSRMTQFRDKSLKNVLRKLDQTQDLPSSLVNTLTKAQTLAELRKKLLTEMALASRAGKLDSKKSAVLGAISEILEDTLTVAASSLGLFAYPVLMAADILLYQANFVPVGEDQTQHLELTRSIAERFNSRFGEVFTLPQAYTPSTTARIMSLQDPTKKMSKSDEPKTYIALSDDADTIRKKIMSAVTETEPVFSFTDSGPAVKNLLTIYQAFSGESVATIESSFAGKGYKEFKEALAEVIIAHLKPIQEKYQAIRANDDELRIILGRGNYKAETVATQTLTRVKEVMGLL